MQRLVLCLVTVLITVVVVGCNGSTRPKSYSATGAYETGADSLSFDLPADFYVYVPPIGGRANARQSESEVLLASESLTGLQAPEVRASETTSVPLTFELLGDGQIEVTSWRVEIRHQVTGASQDEKKDVNPTTRKAVILFSSLPTGRYDTTVEMYGIVTGGTSGGTGNLLFELDIKTDSETGAGS